MKPTQHTERKGGVDVQRRHHTTNPQPTLQLDAPKIAQSSEVKSGTELT